ncbi:hypothetical protein [Nocardia sp. NPDC003963]
MSAGPGDRIPATTPVVCPVIGPAPVVLPVADFADRLPAPVI